MKTEKEENERKKIKCCRATTSDFFYSKTSSWWDELNAGRRKRDKNEPELFLDYLSLIY